MTQVNNNLSEVFNIESPLQGELIMKDGSVVVPDTNNQDEKIDYDYEKTRNNLHGLLAQGQDALTNALEIAKASEQPRAFEVVGMLVKQLSEVNAQLLDLHEKKQKLDGKYDKKDDNNTKNVTNNNAIFVGSTTELNKLIKNMQ
ncbi:small terminase protein [uncultured Caudovirales phage]|uniref:Small terminase protein n=1 Tax=uncultured Caudovirales phage TaxID=2100421 RepID=A0A6J5PH53_9CAUD|nr:small terminase protein [uncultured Caudovirales phage]CAB4170407.1 small terminase protein [uncultured Caudovirales phage]CAB4176864.1 small terminase protein [uncultured Caudovirales phage]CAB4222971.1 small terminase protein [uncultured Caudovirales phage]